MHPKTTHMPASGRVTLLNPHLITDTWFDNRINDMRLRRLLKIWRYQRIAQEATDKLEAIYGDLSPT